ncbi:hypothetical protein [Pseudaeromonas paramecii]|uniref:Uncharacterized protein n=1 Tax=Pseudaeromonas paramecii TaxID=2138166 RepID=A0ABP8Q1C8_9GAMM
MLKACDFTLDDRAFHFRKDCYPLARIRGARVKQLTWLDNLGQILFWVMVFSGAIWLAMQQVQWAPLWLISMACSLTVIGVGVGWWRCGRVVLQIEYRHADETGVQWVNVVKSRFASDGKLLTQQADRLNQLRV